MNIFQEVNINGINIKIHGDVENPLFEAKKILIDLLDYK